VTIASRDPAKLQAAAGRIGGAVRTAVLDTSNDAAVEAFFAAQDEYDHVVISAAQTASGR
jgi:saccharopine dehydrogenase-like NADP-dependent oxidoreductase